MSTAGLRHMAAGRWQALAARERTLVIVAGTLVTVALLWGVAVSPALRTARSAATQIETLDAQLQGMQRLATEVRELRALPVIPPAQARAALDAAAKRLGDKVRVTTQGERANVDVNGLSGEALGAWLAEVRLAARAQVIDAQLVRATDGVYRGRLVLAIGSRP